MKLMVASYNNGGVAWNDEAEETNFLSYKIDHEFNRPATAIIVLRDNDGAVAQKYNVDANDVYVGPGRVTIEDPNATDVFDGRIVKARHDSLHHRVYLLAYDWLSQLNEQRIDYDMREDLDGAGLRESTLASVYTGTCYPVYKLAGVNYALDRTMAWADDQWNDKYLVLPNSMAGNNTVGIGPYSDTVAPATDADLGGFDDLWVDDTNCHDMADDDADWTATYAFRIYVPRSPRLVSITGARVICSYRTNNNLTPCWVSFLDNNAAAYVKLNDLAMDGAYHNATWTIPGQYLTAAILTDANGEATVRFNMDWPAVITQLIVYYLRFEVDVVTTGYASTITITDTSVSSILSVGTDLTNAGVGLWEGCPYCICKEIYKHLHTGLGTLITDGDTMLALTCDGTIEHTTGISTRHYQGRTRLEIMQDLAPMDKAVFWVTLGGLTVTWKSTFNAGAPTAMTDASVLEWRQGEWDYEPMRNEYKVYGVRIGDTQLVGTHDDAACILKYKATRTEVVPNAYTVCQYDTDQLADKLVTRDAVVDLFLTAELPGLSTLRLGSEVAITSTYLNLAAANYVVTRWAYDSSRYRTEIRLAPRTSNGYVEHVSFGEGYRDTVERAQKTAQDAYLAEPYTKVCANP